MKALFWVLALFALAVGLTVAARYSPGYVLVVLPTQRIELSVNLALLLVLAGFIFAYLLLRTVLLTVSVPAKARQYRREQMRGRAQRTFHEALQAYFEGRYARAQQAAREAVTAGEAPQLALTVAARSAHALRQYAARDEYLHELEWQAPGDASLRAMTSAELLLDERRHDEALQALAGLPDKHSAALRLELRALQQARNWERLLQLLPELEKRQLLEPLLLQQLRRHARAENLKHQALDLKSLREFWARMPAVERGDSVIAAAAARSFLALGQSEEAHRIIEQSLEQTWDAALLAAYVEGLPADARHHLEKGEAWLQQHARDPQLLLALGRLCVHQRLWGKAQSYLEASLAVEPSHAAYVELGKLLERLDQPQEASAAYRKGLELALAQLAQSTAANRAAVAHAA